MTWGPVLPALTEPQFLCLRNELGCVSLDSLSRSGVSDFAQLLPLVRQGVLTPPSTLRGCRKGQSWPATGCVGTPEKVPRWPPQGVHCVEGQESGGLTRSFLDAGYF